MKRIVLLSSLLFVFDTFISAQQNTIVATGTGARMHQVGEGVYAILHDNATDEWPHGNTGIIVGRDAVMVIDACYLPSMAREDIRLLRKVTGKPVKYLAFTHWHFDHNNGAIAYRDSFPDITIISERETGKFIELNGIWWSKRSVAKGSSKRADLEALQATLSRGTDTAGVALSSTEQERLKRVIAQRQNEIQELTGLKIVKPDRVFDDSLSIDLGNRQVFLVDWKKANSPHDVTVYVPDSQVLFTGDMLVQSPLPYFGASWPLPWVNVLKQIEAIPVRSLIPGHGPVQLDHGYTRLVRSFLETLMTKVELLIREGRTIEQVQELINMDEFKKGPWVEKIEEVKADWKYNLDTIVERIWRGLRGQG